MSFPLETLMPHRPPMRWIDSLTSCTEVAASAFATFTPEHFAVADGFILEAALVECAAQTVAAAVGYRARSDGMADGVVGASGMLVSVSGFRIQRRPATAKPLRIEVRELKRFGPMLLVSGRVSCEEETIATGELTLYA
jgi:predicted hotdog family 3-hydroxylacyl-ACP dehydratase